MPEPRRKPFVPPKHPRHDNPNRGVPHPSIIEEQQRRRQESPRPQPEIDRKSVV